MIFWKSIGTRSALYFHFDHRKYIWKRTIFLSLMIKEEITNFLKKEISEQLNKIAQDGLNLRMDSTKQAIKRAFIVNGLLGLGLFFVLLGFAKYLPTIVNISEGAAFFLIGLTLMVVGLIYRAGGRD
jgi:hypothetical protein